jgi:hypothetical protein
MEKKPNVIPTKEQRAEAEERAKLDAYEREKPVVMNEVYTNATSPSDTPYAHINAVEMMKRRTEEQMKMRNEIGVVKHPELAETPPPRALTKNEQEILEIRKRAEEQMKIRDQHLANNVSQTQNYQNQYNEAYNKPKQVKEEVRNVSNTPAKQPIMQPQNYGDLSNNIDPYIAQLSQPTFNTAFDVIPLPSKGKVYNGIKPSVKVSYMTTSDENILTSPNLLQSGQFLEILINRKVLEPQLRYKDLLVGDRNAIMIWLRATAYGEMYPVTLFDENDMPFDAEINLNELQIKELAVEPDSEGLFDFTFPISKNHIKFRMMTCGMNDEIDEILENEKEAGIPVNNSSTYTMEKMIVEVNGNRDRNVIRDFVNSIRISDSKSFNEYISSIECGVDMNIEVRTPGGGSIKTFLPLNLNFFWPEFKL